MVEISVDYAQRMEGKIYGNGSAALAKALAEAAAGKSKAAEQSQAVFEAAQKFAVEAGYAADEVFRAEPGSRLAHDSKSFRVCWESGPYEWAIVASDALCQVGVFAEPHYSFDLCFYPSEDPKG